VPSKLNSSVASDSQDAHKESSSLVDTSDAALAALLSRLKAAADPDEIRQLSAQIERLVFHKQITSA
jgi:hypothetical protein